MTDPTKPFRIAIRTEGATVNAYWTRAESMEDAELVASIKWEVLRAEPELQTGFQLLMQAVAHKMVKLRMPGQNVSHIEVNDAPEHEKAGNA